MQSREAWREYWSSGAAIDLSGSEDPRWQELERRIVLSQYLMRVNEAGAWPPQESGLVNNGWHGRFHFEMIWWHELHFLLWNRPESATKRSVFTISSSPPPVCGPSDRGCAGHDGPNARPTGMWSGRI